MYFRQVKFSPKKGLGPEIDRSEDCAQARIDHASRLASAIKSFPSKFNMLVIHSHLHSCEPPTYVSFKGRVLEIRYLLYVNADSRFVPSR